MTTEARAAIADSRAQYFSDFTSNDSDSSEASTVEENGKRKPSYVGLSHSVNGYTINVFLTLNKYSTNKVHPIRPVQRTTEEDQPTSSDPSVPPSNTRQCDPRPQRRQLPKVRLGVRDSYAGSEQRRYLTKQLAPIM